MLSIAVLIRDDSGKNLPMLQNFLPGIIQLMGIRSSKIQKIVAHILDTAGDTLASYILQNEEIFQNYVQCLMQYSDGDFGDQMMRGVLHLFSQAKRLNMTALTDRVFLQVVT